MILMAFGDVLSALSMVKSSMVGNLGRPRGPFGVGLWKEILKEAD